MSTQQSNVLGELVAGLPAAVYRTTSDGQWVAGNRALVDLVGAGSFDELAELNVRDIYADPARRDWLVQRADEGLEIPVEDLQIRRLDGELRWVRVTSHAVHGDDGSVEYFEGVMEDVSSLHAVDSRLQRSNTLLDSLTRMQEQYMSGVDVGDLFDGLLDELLRSTGSEYGFIAQLLHDDNGPFLRTWAMSDISWNDATRAMFQQYGPRGMEFHNLDTLFGRVVTGDAPVVANSVSNDPRAAGRPNGHPPLDTFFGLPIRKGGSVIGMLALANRPGGFDDELVHFLAPLAATVGSLIEAATVERERAEAFERNQRQEELHRSIVEQAADAIVTFRDVGTIVLANRAAAQLVGLEPSEVVGERLRRFIPRELLRDTVEQATRALVRGVSVELTLLRADGSERPIEVTFVQGEYDHSGVTTLIARDIGARKEIEQALRAARDAAQRTARAKDELLAGMSHELRTPLNAVIGLSAVLRREVHGPLLPKQHEYVAQIESSGRHLLEVITTILDQAKAEANKIEPTFAVTDVAELVHSALGLAGELAIGKGLSVAVDVATDLPPIYVDVLRARQVLLNLLSNAVKFTASGGRIGVRAARADDAVAVTVWDTGVGVNPADVDRIFQPFEQADSSLSRRYEGTGLGLALSRRLAELLGGTLTVTSELGEGSEFTVTFPVATTDADTTNL
ncbi:ATP-binding protein [Microcella sp.]|uniref:sensor histidine kinase n=1 Tax=Microcella sp. TaxID=1913979 RepID=UPI00299F7495|nr:ATP-binding protein [Microcella sp.]MDX2026900.1 PAS domain S-box protein [Microcella sp.]